jgi:hypothetical protein
MNASSNVLLTKAIGIGGVAVAVPAVMGTGLIGGTALNYIIDPKGRPVLLFGGIACCFLAVLLNAMGYKIKQREDSARDCVSSDTHSTLFISGVQPPRSFVPGDSQQVGDFDTSPIHVEDCTPSRVEPGKHHEANFVQLLSACAIGGLLAALWSPLSAWATRSYGLGPYVSFFFFNIGQFLVLPILLSPMVTRRALEWGTMRQQLACAFAGLLNCSGLLMLFIAGSAVSFSMSFAIMQCSPCVAAFWGIYNGELRGAKVTRMLCFVLMVFMYGCAISCIAISQVSST